MSMGLRYEAKHKGPFTELMNKWRFAESRLVTLENDKQILENDKKLWRMIKNFGKIRAGTWKTKIKFFERS